MMSEQHYCPLTGDAPARVPIRLRVPFPPAPAVPPCLASAPASLPDEEADRMCRGYGGSGWSRCAGGRVYVWSVQ